MFFLLDSEVIIDAGAQRPEMVTVGYAGDGEVGARQIDVEIFDLGAPARSEAEFGADTRGPARIGVGFRQAECLAAQFAERQTPGAIQQNVVERIADPAAHRAEPWIRKLPGRKCLVGAGNLDVAFDAEHPRLIQSPIVAALHAAHKTRRLGRIVIDGAPSVTDIAAEIGADPAIFESRLDGGVVGLRIARSSVKIGSLRGGAETRG